MYDPNTFLFSFESHGRCTTPQRFLVRDEVKARANVWFFRSDEDGWFVHFSGGQGYVGLGNERSATFCSRLSRAFEGIDDTTLTGAAGDTTHHCARLVAVQLV